MMDSAAYEMIKKEGYPPGPNPKGKFSNIVPSARWVQEPLQA